jgi:hypothetical protein
MPEDQVPRRANEARHSLVMESRGGLGDIETVAPRDLEPGAVQGSDDGTGRLSNPWKK